ARGALVRPVPAVRRAHVHGCWPGAQGRAPAHRPVLMDSEQHLARVQELTEALEALPDGREKEVAEDLIGAIVELYGHGFRRVVEALDDAGAPGQAIHGRLIDDGVGASLLLIHDLYPIDLETRVREALDGVRPYMESHGGDVELLGLEDGIARLRLAGSCD